MSARYCDVTGLYQAFTQRTGPGMLFNCLANVWLHLVFIRQLNR